MDPAGLAAATTSLAIGLYAVFETRVRHWECELAYWRIRFDDHADQLENCKLPGIPIHGPRRIFIEPDQVTMAPPIVYDRLSNWLQDRRWASKKLKQRILRWTCQHARVQWWGVGHRREAPPRRFMANRIVLAARRWMDSAECVREELFENCKQNVAFPTGHLAHHNLSIAGLNRLEALLKLRRWNDFRMAAISFILVAGAAWLSFSAV